MRKSLLPLLVLALPFFSHAQKRVISYPFEFEKSFLARGDYDAYFLGNAADSGFALVLKDNKKTEYVLLNKSFKVQAKIPSAIESTVFDERVSDYTGGTTNGHEFHFIYSGRSGYQMETVNFDTKEVRHKKLFEEAKAEDPLVAFSDNNMYYAITTNDKTGELSFYIVKPNGELEQKSLSFPIPADASKSKRKLSSYLSKLKVVKNSEQPDLSTAIQSAKLFVFPDRLDFVVNDDDNPTHIVSISLPNFRVSQKDIDYKAVVSPEDKGNLYVSSFEKDGRLFSLLLNKKNIRIAVHDLSSGSLLNKYEITEDAGSNLFAETPVSERRMGKRAEEKDIDDVKKLIKALTKGSEGLMVTQNRTGQLVVTVGTYDLIQMSSGGGGGYVGGFQTTAVPTTPSLTNHGATVEAQTRWNPTMYYRPGSPSYTTTSARYYTTTHFKLLLDPNTFKVVRGRVPVPIADQIKDYMQDVDSKAKATNQFSIGTEQYYGYYDRDAKAYVIEQIRIMQ